MKQQLTSKYSAPPGSSGGESLPQRARFGGSDTFRRGAPGGKVRTLKPLGPTGSRQSVSQASEQDDELPAGNCSIM